MTDTIPRIGREPTPAEAALQWVRERPEVLDHAARNLMGHRRRLQCPQKRAAWAAFTEPEREKWRRIALRLFERRAERGVT